MSLDVSFFFRILVFPGFLFLLLFALFCDWFERKIMARMQNRMAIRMDEDKLYYDDCSKSS